MRLFEPLAGAACLARAHGLHIDERDPLAESVQFEAPVVVCLANPPYRRGRATASPVGDFVDGVDGLQVKNLYNDYVYFWRWTLDAVFERRAGPAILSLVTASSYLRGPSFTGMRRALRTILDELWIVDLEGDRLAARRTHNVFPIRTPVAIALGVRYAQLRPDVAAPVHYTRLEGRSDEKLGVLERLNRLDDLVWHDADAGWGQSLVPRGCSAYERWPRLTELFPWQVSGAQLKRTWPIGVTAEVLHGRWTRLLGAPDRAAAFGLSRDRDLDSSPPDLRDPTLRLERLASLDSTEPCIEPVRYAYRSFDRQWVLPDARLGDFMRPALWRALGPSQLFLTSLLTNVLGPGPAAVATTLVPDLDHFRGSFGARAVIPLWRDCAATQPNVDGSWLDRLRQQYGFSVSPGHLMAYCYALLGTRAYVARFEEELRTPGPRIPLTSNQGLFERGVALGERLLVVHTYRQVTPTRARVVAPVGEEYPRTFGFDVAGHVLRVGDGAIAPVSPEVWGYGVSGMPIVRSWLRRRLGPRRRRSALDAIQPRSWTPPLSRELLELVWLLEATLDLEPALGSLLGEIASGSCLNV
jgi:hypothetical protein